MIAGPAGETSAAEQLEQNVWKSSFQQSFAAWSSARHSEKPQHMLTGAILARAEQHLLTGPKSFNDDEKRFIITSLTRATVAAARRRVLEEGVPERSSSKSKWVAALVVAGIGWLWLPELFRRGIEHQEQVRVARGGDGQQPTQARKKYTLVITPSGSITRRLESDIGVPSPNAAVRPAASPTDADGRPVSAVPQVMPRAPRVDDGRIILRQRVDELADRARDRLQKGDQRASLLISLEALHRVAGAKPEQQSLDLTMTVLSPLYEGLTRPIARIAELGTEQTAPILSVCAGLETPTDTASQRVDPLSTAARRLISAPGGVIDARCRQYLQPADDYAIVLRDVATGRQQAALRGHESDVLAMAISPNGARAISGSADRTARLWDLGSGRARVLEGHDESVSVVAFSADGRLVATGGADRVIRLWDTRTGRAARTLGRHFGDVTSVLFSTSGERIASVSVDGFARLWSLSDDAPPVLLRMDGTSVVGAGFSRDGRRFFTLAQDGATQVWDALSGTALAQVRTPKAQIAAAELSPDGKWLLTRAWNGMIAIWSAESGTLGAALTGSESGFLHATFDANASDVTIVAADGTVSSVPYFATITEAAEQARERAGLCLEATERQALRLDGDVPGWCLLGKLPDIDKSLVLNSPTPTVPASGRPTARTAVRN